MLQTSAGSEATQNYGKQAQEWGIFLDDMLAEGDFSDIEHLTGGFYRTPLASIIQRFLIPGTWYWSYTDKTTPTTQSFGSTSLGKKSA